MRHRLINSLHSSNNSHRLKYGKILHMSQMRHRLSNSLHSSRNSSRLTKNQRRNYIARKKKSKKLRGRGKLKGCKKPSRELRVSGKLRRKLRIRGKLRGYKKKTRNKKKESSSESNKKR
jgi:hypothetical protein